MHSTSSVAPLQISYHLKPIRFQACRLHPHLHQTITRTRTTSKITCQPSFTETYVPNYSFYCGKQVQESSSSFSSSSSSSPLLSNKNQNNGFLKKKPNSPIGNTPNKGHRRTTNNMWWTDLKAALGQRINVEGVLCFVSVVSRDKQLALPHVSVRDIRYIDWAALKQEGFQGVVFDKDNTLTAPYSLNLWGPLAPSIESCKSVFGNNIAVFSNSAGLYEYDPDGRKARALEFMIGIKVIRHRVKKPAGTAEEVERHFGCESSRLIMVGDRPFTDIVFGNQNGFLTILTEPLSLTEEPFIVKQEPIPSIRPTDVNASNSELQFSRPPMRFTYQRKVENTTPDSEEVEHPYDSCPTQSIPSTTDLPESNVVLCIALRKGEKN